MVDEAIPSATVAGTLTPQRPDNNTLYYDSTTANATTPGGVRGLVQSTTDAAGLTTLYTYNLEGQVKQVSRQWVGQTTPVLDSLTDYDPAGRVIKVTDADGKAAETFYDALGRVSDTKDKYGGITHSDYDLKGNLIRTLYYRDGTETRTTYDAMGRAEWTTTRYKSNTNFDPQTRQVVSNDDTTKAPTATRAVYDSLGRVVRTEQYRDVLIKFGASTLDASTPDTSTLQLLSTSTTEYDAAGRVHAQTDSAGLRAINSYYDDGRLRATQSLAGTTAPVTSYDYDPKDLEVFEVGGTIETTDVFTVTLTSTSGVSEPRFDVTAGSTSASAVATAIANTLNASASVHAVAEGNSVRVTPEAANYRFVLSLKTTEDGSTTPGDDQTFSRRSIQRVTDAAGHATTTESDALGRGARTTFADGTYIETLYGIRGQPVPGHVVLGQTITGRQETRIDQQRIATDYFYDVSGRLTDVYLPAVIDADAVDVPETPDVDERVKRPHWHYAYDANGNQTGQTDPRGNTTTFGYDGQNRRTRRTLPDGKFEEWDHDAYGRTSLHVQFRGANQTAGDVARTVYVYYPDNSVDAGRLQEEQRFEAGTTQYPERTTYGYDDLGRQDEVKEYGSGSTGTLDRTTTYAYDPVTGGVTQVASPEGTVNYAYQLSTRRLERTWTASNDTRYTYDKLGRLETVFVSMRNGVVPSASEQTRYTYDAVGNLDTVTLPNGVVSDYNYDALNRLDTLTVRDAQADKLFEQDYALLNNGQRDYVVERRYDGASAIPFSNVKIDWTYDALGRLTQEVRDADPTPGDGSDNFGTQEGDDYTDAYSFDLSGNRVRKSHDEADPDKDAATAYTYNARDQLTGEGPDANGDNLPDSVTTSYGYDDNGSMTSKATGGITSVYGWDLRGRMTGYDADSTDPYKDATYTYDHDGLRVSTTTSSTGTTLYLLDHNNPTGYAQVLEEKASATAVPTKSYVLGQDVIAQGTSGGLQYLLYDGHGSTRGLTDDKGVVVDANGTAVGSGLDYDAYGNPVEFTVSDAATLLLYAGEHVDPVSGMYNLRARQYDPRIGRFPTVDPFLGAIDDPATLHKYLYAAGNPIAYSDPTGESYIETMKAVGIKLTLGGFVFSVATNALGFGLDVATGSTIAQASRAVALGLGMDAVTGGVFSKLKAFRYLGYIFKLRKSSSVFKRAANSVWALNDVGIRGLKIEDMLLPTIGRLPAGFDTIDFFLKGIAISVKSIDLTLPGYQKAGSIAAALRGYGSELELFKIASKRNVTVAASQIKERILLVAIEKGAATRSQMEEIIEFMTEVPNKFPGIKVVVEEIE